MYLLLLSFYSYCLSHNLFMKDVFKPFSESSIEFLVSMLIYS